MFRVDHYDDPSILGRLPATLRTDLTKVAADLTDQLDGLSDSEFALVLYAPGDPPAKHRKFACVDEGNVALSTVALLRNQTLLPQEAVKVAAENLLRCTQDFGMYCPPELEKLAGTKEPSPETNLVMLDPGAPPPLPQVKTASAPEDVGVKVAMAYFYDNEAFLTGWEKRALAKHIVKQAEAEEVHVPSPFEKYASDTYAPDLFEAILMRQAMCVAADESDGAFEKAAMDTSAYGRLFQSKDSLDPGAFAQNLDELDRATGLFDSVPDAVYSTFGKVAQEPEVLFNDGINSITKGQLEWLTTNRQKIIEEQFGNHLAEEMRKNPEAIFNSLPRPQKVIISRLANQITAEHGVQV